jgi:pyruvate kinase
MVRIAVETERHRATESVSPLFSVKSAARLSTADAVSYAARQTAHDLEAAAIITPTVSGHTARLMACYRPRSPIIAVTPSPVVQRQLVLYWGVVPLLAPRTNNSDEMIAQAVQAARDRKLVHEGDTLVVTAGAAGSAPGTTNLMRIHTVGA